MISYSTGALISPHLFPLLHLYSIKGKYLQQLFSNVWICFGVHFEFIIQMFEERSHYQQQLLVSILPTD